eukprot:g13589.t1
MINRVNPINSANLMHECGFMARIDTNVALSPVRQELTRLRAGLTDSQARHRDTALLLERLSGQNASLRAQLRECSGRPAETDALRHRVWQLERHLEDEKRRNVRNFRPQSLSPNLMESDQGGASEKSGPDPVWTAKQAA